MSTHNYGSFDIALQNLISTLNDGTPEQQQVLNQWDRDRGNSWYVGTEYIQERGVQNELHP